MSPRRNFILALLLAATAAFAQEKNAGQATAPTPPVPPPATFTLGEDIRLRYEVYDNAQTLSSDAAFHLRDYFRLRGRVWVSYNVTPSLALFTRISAEPRYWFHNSSSVTEGCEWKYAIDDCLYAKWSTPASDNIPVTVVVGRQDIQFGDQWLVSDGTPGDGSWTTFFDGARATFDVKSIKTKIDVVAFYQQAHPEDHIPILGRPCVYPLSEQDEIGAILYASNKSLKNIQLDGYLIYKEDDKVTANGNNGVVYTAGARIAGTPSLKWQYSAEGACQWGSRDLQVRYPTTIFGKRDVAAFGAIAKLTYQLKDTLNNQITLLTEYLSGDDPDTTGKDEMFDVLWGRYPRVGETWAAAYVLEAGGRPSQFENLFRLGGTWTVAPFKNTTVATSYFAMFAPEAVPTRTINAARYSREGHYRGDMLQLVVRQKITKELSALFFAEASYSGDYYASHTRISFVRAEVMYTF